MWGNILSISPKWHKLISTQSLNLELLKTMFRSSGSQVVARFQAHLWIEFFISFMICYGYFLVIDQNKSVFTQRLLRRQSCGRKRQDYTSDSKPTWLWGVGFVHKYNHNIIIWHLKLQKKKPNQVTHLSLCWFNFSINCRHQTDHWIRSLLGAQSQVCFLRV